MAPISIPSLWRSIQAHEGEVPGTFPTCTSRSESQPPPFFPSEEGIGQRPVTIGPPSLSSLVIPPTFQRSTGAADLLVYSSEEGNREGEEERRKEERGERRKEGRKNGRKEIMPCKFQNRFYLRARFYCVLCVVKSFNPVPTLEMWVIVFTVWYILAGI